MSKETTYAVIIRADHHTDGRYLASCPDIPGWFATGASAEEASDAASEIVRGIVSERRTKGIAVPEVSVQTTQVVVDSSGSSQTAASLVASAPSTDAEEQAEENLPTTTLASIVARSREHHLLENDEDDQAVYLSSEPIPGRVMKSGK